MPSVLSVDMWPSDWRLPSALRTVRSVTPAARARIACLATVLPLSSARTASANATAFMAPVTGRASAHMTASMLMSVDRALDAAFRQTCFCGHSGDGRCAFSITIGVRDNHRQSDLIPSGDRQGECPRQSAPTTCGACNSGFRLYLVHGQHVQSTLLRLDPLGDGSRYTAPGSPAWGRFPFSPPCYRVAAVVKAISEPRRHGGVAKRCLRVPFRCGAPAVR